MERGVKREREERVEKGRVVLREKGRMRRGRRR